MRLNSFDAAFRAFPSAPTLVRLPTAHLPGC